MTEYKNPALTVDITVFAKIDGNIKVLLIQRKNPPFQGKWAIPGGFVDYEEEIETAAHRELQEETGVKNVKMEQVYTFGKVGRDPRGRTVSVVYFAMVDINDVTVKANDDAADAQWFRFDDLPELAFDHAEIMEFVIDKYKQKLTL